MSEKQALIDRIDLSWSDLMASMDGSDRPAGVRTWGVR